MSLFEFILFYYITLFYHIHTVPNHLSPFAEVSLSIKSPVSSAGKTSRGAERGFELGPAVQQADALPTGLQ